MKKQSKKHAVPGCSSALNKMKYEIAHEIGLFAAMSQPLSEFSAELAHPTEQSTNNNTLSYDWGQKSSREVGFVGGQMTAKLIQMAQQSLLH